MCSNNYVISYLLKEEVNLRRPICSSQNLRFFLEDPAFSLDPGTLAKCQLKHQKTSQSYLLLSSSVSESITVSFETWTSEKSCQPSEMTS